MTNLYENLLDVNNYNVLVVGGTGGLGLEISKAYLVRGSKVVIAGRNEDSFKLLKKQEIEYENNLFFVPVDLSSEDSINSMTSKAIEILGNIDVLVNSGGMNILKAAEDYDYESFRKIMDINMNSIHLICKNIGYNMIKNNRGAIINISSMKSVLGTDKDYVGYCASKAAVNMYTKQLACEWAKYKIRCNVIAPTFIETNINKKQLENIEFKNSIVNRIPLKRLGKKEDIAKLALFLGSEDSSFITGQVLFLDGGLTARQ